MLHLDRAGDILSLFIPAVWQENAKSSSPFYQILWDGSEIKIKNNALVPILDSRNPYDFETWHPSIVIG